MTGTLYSGRGRWVVGMLVIALAITGCDTNIRSEPPHDPPASTTPAALPGPGPWTLAQLSESPCAVLTAEDITSFALKLDKVDATPGRRCAWESVSQPDLYDSHFANFRPDSQARYPGEIRPVDPPGLPETETEIGGRRATLKSVPRADGRHGACVVRVWVPSGGSFEFQIRAGTAFIGVDWDICAKTVAMATVISARLR